MSGSNPYDLEYYQAFEDGVNKLFKHYKKNPKGEEEFEILLGLFADQLRENPDAIKGTSREQWPKKSNYPGWEFWKIRFRMPRLSGKSGCGRLMYIKNEAENSVYALFLYTHVEFKKRPPDKTIKKAVDECTDRD